MNDYYWIVATCMIIIGLFVLVLGLKLFKPTIFIFFSLSVLGLIMIFFYALILPTGTKDWTVWVIGGVGLLLGIITGFFMVKLAKLSIGLLGAWIGFVGGLLIHQAFLYHSSQQWLFWVVCIGLALVGFVVAFIKYKAIVIVATSFLGSYMLVRGLSLFIGGYPNEFTLISKIRNGGATDVLHWPFYLYLVAIAILTLSGIIIQSKLRKGKSTEDSLDHYYKRV